ncbi:hypothetical protein H0264_28890 [Nocardia huaxiensis]|uniref:Uncharacterized protein n=1 Tax=Nocardia huaxiensis TaxID=2755382 RepID=A0A7D6ZFS4_9NOCA|nr:hypothetical protein [Nocardia huaxiensis]QLY29267.1 hypothetical protein H0264_28890 [Nocardia huaxiensis]
MAYLGTTAAAASLGDYGRGGSGEIELHWHNMPDATVELLAAGDIRGDIEIRWRLHPRFEGMFADLTVDEARILRDNLNRAISRFFGIDNAVEDIATVNGDATVFEPEKFVFCDVCRGRIWEVHSTFGTWWTHADEPDFGHDAVPAPEPVRCGQCGGRIELIDSPHDRWWAHFEHPADDHDAVPAEPGAEVA